MTTDKARSELIRMFMDDRHFAHRFLFPHRHPLKNPDYAWEMTDLYYSNRPRVLWEIYRGGAKSTTSEEAIMIQALLKERSYIGLIRETADKAAEAVMTIRHELMTNERIREVFGDLETQSWNQDDIILANGVRIKGWGWGQSIRGAKDWRSNERPDFFDIDDLENEDAIGTPEARAKTPRWFDREVIPALRDYNCPVRVKGTRLHPEAWIAQLADDPEWHAVRIPVAEGLDGPNPKSNWPAKFPLETVLSIRSRFEKDGDLNGFAQEYLCQSVDEKDRPFQPRHIVVSPSPTLHVPRYVIVDPARTVKKTSARTGYLAAGWDRRTLVVYEAFGGFDKPDRIIETCFQLADRHRPVHLGVEADGLHEFLMQPLRAEMLRRGTTLPLLPLMAPKDRNKERFILGLHSFFEAGDIVLAHHLPELEQEILNFPQGRVDVLNCLAYMLKVRSGDAVYEDFTDRHVIEGEIALPRGKFYVTVLGDQSETALVATLASDSGRLLVLADEVCGTDEGSLEAALQRLAPILGQGNFQVVFPLGLTDRDTPFVRFAQRHNLRVIRGPKPDKAQGALGRLMATFRRGEPMLQVSSDARWTVNALGAGYRRAANKDGTPGPTMEGAYGLVGRALDVLAEFLSAAGSDAQSDRFGYTSDGTRYRTSLPRGN